jgi:hypothetical protein
MICAPPPRKAEESSKSKLNKNIWGKKEEQNKNPTSASRLTHQVKRPFKQDSETQSGVLYSHDSGILPNTKDDIRKRCRVDAPRIAKRQSQDRNDTKKGGRCHLFLLPMQGGSRR